MNTLQEDSDRRSFFYNRIYVIESLGKGEKPTGETLFEDLLTRETYRNSYLSADYKYCLSKQQLFLHLIKIKADVSTGQIMPFIHFECHGSKKGLVLESKEEVRWEELITYLTEINILVKNNLFVSFAVCYSFYLYHDIAIAITKRAPFFGFISSPQEVYPDEYVNGFYEFFDRILNGTDLLSALDSLNSNCVDGEKFVFDYGENIFENAWNAYDNQFNDPKVYKQKLYFLMSVLFGDLKLRHRYSYDQIKDFAKDSLSAENRRAMRQEGKKHFLMLDLKP